jgi:hypothetical protein
MRSLTYVFSLSHPPLAKKSLICLFLSPCLINIAPLLFITAPGGYERVVVPDQAIPKPNITSKGRQCREYEGIPMRMNVVNEPNLT